MNRETLLQPAAWGGKIPEKRHVIFQMPLNVGKEFEWISKDAGVTYQSLLDTPQSTPRLPHLKSWIKTIQPTIKAAPGFACLSMPEKYQKEEQLRLLYLLISREFGDLNNRYGYFFDVIDQGLDHTKEAIPISKTRATTGYHTDSTAREYQPDIVGLLCINSGKIGGESLLCNAADIYQHLFDQYPESLKILSSPIIRDVITPGSKQIKEAILNNKFPIFSLDENGLKFRYMRYWVESAYKKTGIPLPTNLHDAMNHIDDYLADERHIFSIQLRRGDMIFINNNILCHNRTAFIDYDEPHRKRRLTRTWINWHKTIQQ